MCVQESSNLSLVSRLQMRIKQLEWERALLRREVDRKEAKLDGGGKSGDDLEKEIYESIKASDFTFSQDVLIGVVHCTVSDLLDSPNVV